jgi:hypothetical protein
VYGVYDPHDRAGQREEKANEESLSFEQRWQEDIELAYGEMNLLPHDFLEMRPCDWIAKKRGYYRKQEKQWEHTRLVVAALTGEKPTKIIKLSSDTVEKAKAPAPDMAAILEKYKDRLTP